MMRKRFRIGWVFFLKIQVIGIAVIISVTSRKERNRATNSPFAHSHEPHVPFH